MKFFIIFMTLFFLTACNEMDGYLKVVQNIGLYTSNGKLIELNKGSYNAGLKVENKKFRLLMDIQTNKNITDKSKWTKVYFTLPPEICDANYSGQINVPADENGQNYDLVGEVGKFVTQGEQKTETRVCVYDYTYHYHCYYDSHHQQHCYWEKDPIYGQQQVIYHYVYHTTKIEGSLMLPGTQDRQAISVASKTESERVDDFVEYCHL